MNYSFKEIVDLGWLLLIQASYYFIYCYTKLELFCKPKLKLLAHYAGNKNKNKRSIHYDYIKNGVVTEKELPIEDIDFVLYSDVTETITNKIIRKTIHLCEPIIYEVSNEKFIMVEITVENETIPIKFSDDCINYYIVGNCFDSNFILFFITKHYPDFCKTKTHMMKSYKLKIIDSNVEIKELDETNSIIIAKDGYDILPYK